MRITKLKRRETSCIHIFNVQILLVYPFYLSTSFFFVLAVELKEALISLKQTFSYITKSCSYSRLPNIFLFFWKNLIFDFRWSSEYICSLQRNKILYISYIFKTLVNDKKLWWRKTNFDLVSTLSVIFSSWDIYEVVLPKKLRNPPAYRNTFTWLSVMIFTISSKLRLSPTFSNLFFKKRGEKNYRISSVLGTRWPLQKKTLRKKRSMGKS